MKRQLLLFPLLLLAYGLLAQEMVLNPLAEFTINPPSRTLTAHFSYGFAQPNLNGVTAEFGRGGNLEATLGVKRFLASDYGEQQLDYAHIFLFAGFSTAGKGVRNDTLQVAQLAAIGSTAIRLGFGARDGSSYRFQEVALLTPYLSSGQFWTTLSFKQDSIGVDNENRIARFSGGVKYGTFTQSGVMIDVGKKFAFDLGFETAIVQPRYVFLQSFSNLLLQQFAHFAMRLFIDRVLPPSASALASFTLKTAFNFWLYNLRREQANFPFSSESGYNMVTFKVGASFSI